MKAAVSNRALRQNPILGALLIEARQTKAGVRQMAGEARSPFRNVMPRTSNGSHSTGPLIGNSVVASLASRAWCFWHFLDEWSEPRAEQTLFEVSGRSGIPFIL